MSLNQHKTPIKSDCSIEKALMVIFGKWKSAILGELLKNNLNAFVTSRINKSL